MRNGAAHGENKLIFAVVNWVSYGAPDGFSENRSFNDRGYLGMIFCTMWAILIQLSGVRFFS